MSAIEIYREFLMRFCLCASVPLGCWLLGRLVFANHRRHTKERSSPVRVPRSRKLAFIGFALAVTFAAGDKPNRMAFPLGLYSGDSAPCLVSYAEPSRTGGPDASSASSATTDIPVIATDLGPGDSTGGLVCPDESSNASSLCIFGIAPESDRTLLGISWENRSAFPTSWLDLFGTGEIGSGLPWAYLGRFSVSGAVSNAVVSLAWPDSSPSAFYTVADQDDSDDDELSDTFERLVSHTSATQADSDGDGIGDGLEMTLGTDPNAMDTDGDGLTDPEEIGYVEVMPEGETYWQYMTNERSLWSGNISSDYGSLVVDLPHPFTVNGVVYTQMRVCVDGLVYLLNPAWPTHWFVASLFQKPSLATTELCGSHIAIAGLAADLYINGREWGSSVVCGESTLDSGPATVVDFYRIGFADCVFGNSPDLVSYQLVLPGNETNVFYLTYHRFYPASGLAARSPAIGVQCPMLDPLYAGESYYNLTVPPTEEFFNAMRRVKVTIGRGTDPRSDDTDGDGFTDTEEIQVFRTDPRVADDDSDGDGLPDVVELSFGSDPLQGDTDRDGLSDRDEYLLSTDPRRSDSDRDGMPDGWEVSHGLDPLLASGQEGTDDDPDSDGLTNLGEYLNNCDPHVPDTDGDGANDGTEVSQGSDPADASDRGEAPAADRFRELSFNIDGDWAAWEMTIEGLGPYDGRVRKVSMGAPDIPETTVFRLRKGNKYRLSMRWLNCDGHMDNRAPWYCWQALIDGIPDSTTYDDYSDSRLEGNEVIAGNGWIAENADGLLTSHVHESTLNSIGGFGGGNVAEGLIATLHVLDDPKIVPDYDRDGDINAADEGKSRQSGSVFRFWLNDDEDRLATDGKYSESPRVNIPGARDGWFEFDRRDPDFESETVDGICDLLDFAPILADVSNVVSNLPAAVRGQLTYRLRQRDGVFKAVWTNLPKETANAFQKTSFATGFGETFGSAPQNATVTEISTDGIELPSAFSALAATRGGIFLVEGACASSDPLWLEIWYDSTVLCSNKLDLCVSPVEEMYRLASLRDAAANPQASVISTNELANLAADAKDLDVFFLHGFNVDAEAARAWGSEVFKRLWQSGSNARFHILPWRGDYSWSFGDTFNGLHYQHNVWFAQRTGGALKRYVESAQPDASKRILMTQSLGNMVACEALRQGLHVAQYYMFDAAIASEAIDGTLRAETPSPDNAYNKYVRPEWRDYPSACWAANWYQLFADDATDARGRMGWKNRFQEALGNADEVFNYYSSGDTVFSETDAVPSLLDGATHWGLDWLLWIIPYPTIETTFENHCWQKQEVLKGMATVAGTLSGGWGFRVWQEYDSTIGDFRAVRYSPEGAAAALASGSIVNNPVFDVSDAAEMTNRNATEDDIHLALAKHVPALSSPVGGMAVVLGERIENHDLNAENEYRNAWGRSDDSIYQSNWLHSDMKDMAYFYVYKLYNQLVEKGSLR